MTSEKAGSASPVTEIDVSDTVRLRQRVSRAAKSLKVIGLLSAVTLLFDLYGYLEFLPALLCAMLLPGSANLVAQRLRSGSVRAAAAAAVWGLLWLGFVSFDAFPKAFKNGLDTYSFLGSLIFCVPLLFLALGLVAVIRHRSAMVAAGEADLRAHPWEEGLRVKVRPRFVNVNLGAVLFVLLSPLPLLFLWLSQIAQETKLFSDSARLAGYILGTWSIIFGSIYWGVRIYRRARRKALLPGSALAKKDPRPVVLYLRSFNDDSALRMWARTTNGRILPERLVRASFEEVVTDHLWGYGPVRAIGDPRARDKTAPLGAARDYTIDSDWQNQVVGLMRQACMIVAVAAESDGLAWEIDAVVKHGFLPKFVLLLPPVDSQEREARLCFLANRMAGLDFPFRLALERLRSVIFPEGRVTLICGGKRNDWTYEACLDQAALAILDVSRNRPAISPSPIVPSGQLLRELALNALTFARSSLAFLTIGTFMFFAMAVNQIRMENSHPYVHSGEERDEFVAETIKRCKKTNSELSEDVLGNYCGCYATRIADVLTYAELEARLDFKPGIMAGVRDLEVSLKEKTKMASDACYSEAFER